jgi:hypothetical protein
VEPVHILERPKKAATVEADDRPPPPTPDPTTVPMPAPDDPR